MMRARHGKWFSVLVVFLVPARAPAAPVGTAFTYQGQLKQNGVPVNDTCDFEFSLWENLANPDLDGRIGHALVFDGLGGNPPPVAVANGLFTVALDFGASAFNGQARWLQVSVGCPSGSGLFTALTPRQKLTAAPYAVKTRGMFVDDAGNVGIGTTGPTAKLQVQYRGNGGTGYRNIGLISSIESFTPSLTFEDMSASVDDYAAYLNQNQFTIGRYSSDTSIAPDLVLRSGHVGIGTSDPQGRLQIHESDNSVWNHFILSKSSGNFGMAYFGSTSGGIIETTEGPIRFYTTDGGSRTERITVTPTGNVGIGTPTPAGRLHVHKNAGSSATAAFILSTVLPGGHVPELRFNGPEIDAWTSAIPGDAALHLNRNSGGDVHIATGGGRAITSVLQITGGADVAEPFDINASAGTAKPGMVVCIDPQNPRQLAVCRKVHDRAVAGVISGAGGIKAGMLMGQRDSPADGEQPVALTGRVYVLADSSNGPIQPGDLLTTSRTPGHAMKVTDYGKAQGAILGKAMTALREGKGLVLVLVSLQ